MENNKKPQLSKEDIERLKKETQKKIDSKIIRKDENRNS